MKRKNLYLIAAILSTINLIDLLTDPGPREMFGISMNIWIHRAFWLLFTITFVGRYLQLRKAESKPE